MPNVLRSMATAPRDGTVIIVVYDDYSNMFPVVWDKYEDNDTAAGSWFVMSNEIDIGEGDISDPDEAFCGWFECPPEIQTKLFERGWLGGARNSRAIHDNDEAK